MSTLSTATITTPALVGGRSLISAGLFARLTARIADEHPELATDMPARIMDQALAFLGTCAVATRPVGPSETVDIGWHTFVLYTAEYAEFCTRVAGRFIHHVPDDDPTVSPVQVKLADVVAVITAAGYRVDPGLWPLEARSDCSQCHAGCHDTPVK
ncbi:glycine-rich domain-containing protein [Actinoplanes derwentensis]|uniref:Uncharacterized protein n=1 Tax=Actinoplanes derwentensis TaxID=113562 RepID=A0A1H2CWA1_9ACTN|nr:hypothetical protein [Actinoplanes derwentensis]GID82071.1 hypothetical protein Ade03nite_09950 [Actinoplanes derwentensis]SDT74547.1 hypothetical protein SAMN04489716_7015 [Actinoplanes derwentensis]